MITSDKIQKISFSDFIKEIINLFKDHNKIDVYTAEYNIINETESNAENYEYDLSYNTYAFLKNCFDDWNKGFTDIEFDEENNEGTYRIRMYKTEY
jgi:hypothetical protein